jgi:hypothetical protein
VVDPENVVVLVLLLLVVVVVVVVDAIVTVVVVGGIACGMNGSLLLKVDSAASTDVVLVLPDASDVGVVAGRVIRERVVVAEPPPMHPANTLPTAKARMVATMTEVTTRYLKSSSYWLVGAAVVAVEPAAVVAVVG